MKAMILAAGRGERMKPLTDTTPKPLLKVGGKALIVHHVEKLAAVGIKDIIINIAWLAEQVQALLGSGEEYGVRIEYSHEKNGALETAGGIATALPFFNGETSFLVVNGDVYTDYDFKNIPTLSPEKDALLWLVDNPEHNPDGDFVLTKQGEVKNKGENVPLATATYSGIALFRPEFFTECKPNVAKALGGMLREGVERDKVSAIKLNELWTDVGTPQRLEQLNQFISDRGF